MDAPGQGLSPTPEGTSKSLRCGQRIATPELTDSQNSNFEVISDTESEKRPDRRRAPASGALGTLGGATRTDLDRPPLRFNDLYALARSAPMGTYDMVAANVRQGFQTVHDQDTLAALPSSDGHGDGQSGNRRRDLPTSPSTSRRRTSHTSRVPGTCPTVG